MCAHAPRAAQLLHGDNSLCLYQPYREQKTKNKKSISYVIELSHNGRRFVTTFIRGKAHRTSIFTS